MINENNRSSGMRKEFYFDLSNARSAKEISVKGRYIRVVDASSQAAEISIAIENNIPSQYQKLFNTGRIFEGQGFGKIFIEHEAQAGEWIKFIVTGGPDDFDVDNGSQDVIQSITDAVKVKNDPDNPTLKVDDDATQTALASILAMLQNADDQRAGLTDLTGASYASANNATTTLATAGANTNGVIIRALTLTGNGGSTGSLQVGGSAAIMLRTIPSFQNEIVQKDIFVPAGVQVDIVSGSANVYAYAAYEVL